MKILYLLLILNTVLCTSLKAKQDHGTDYLELLQIKHEEMLSILDSIIKYEKQCVYYTPELIFCIHPRKINDTIVEVQIEAMGSYIVKSDMYSGCFDFGGHLFLVRDNDEYKIILKNTNKKRRIYYYIPEKGEIAVYEDDNYSMWIYHYMNDNFIFKEMWENYCKEPCLDQDGLMKR